VDVIDGYSTDGFIARYNLVVLVDDRRFFPPYQAAVMVGHKLVRERPMAMLALTELSGRLDEAAMRALNRRIEVDGEPVARVAADALREMGGNGREREGTGGNRQEREGTGENGRVDSASLVRLTLRHLFLVALSLGLAVAVAIPAGLLLERLPRGAEGAIRAVGVIQTIPGLALVAFMLPVLGIGTAPAVAALFLYSLYPIVRNTYTGVREADRNAVAAALAAGMTPAQTLRYVRLPLAAPVIMAGVRTAAVINVGTATLAALIGAGGLGDPIVAGLALADTRMVLSGAVPAALLALLVDALLGVAERMMRPDL
jgi:osmoprotectant transport system permease protein